MFLIKATLLFSFITINCISIMGQDVKIFGHRGCRGLLPENTISTFIKAIEIGVDGIEWDVVVNKNNELIISHEPYIDTKYCNYISGKEIKDKSKEKLNIYKMSLEEIKKFDCGNKANKNFPDQLQYWPNPFFLIIILRLYLLILREFYHSIVFLS